MLPTGVIDDDDDDCIETAGRIELDFVNRILHCNAIREFR